MSLKLTTLSLLNPATREPRGVFRLGVSGPETGLRALCGHNHKTEDAASACASATRGLTKLREKYEFA